MTKIKIPNVKLEHVPSSGVVDYSVEKRMLDWEDYDKVINIGNWFKINLKRGLVLSKYKQFKTALLISYIVILIIGIIIGWLI